jgi:hypothetical protein
VGDSFRFVEPFARLEPSWTWTTGRLGPQDLLERLNEIARLYRSCECAEDSLPPRRVYRRNGGDLTDNGPFRWERHLPRVLVHELARLFKEHAGAPPEVKNRGEHYTGAFLEFLNDTIPEIDPERFPRFNAGQRNPQIRNLHPRTIQRILNGFDRD